MASRNWSERLAILCAACLVAVILFAAPSATQGAESSALSSSSITAALQQDSLDLTADQGNFIFAAYKRFISPIDGERCPMQPSCSQYAREAFHQRGFIQGLLLTFDRLLRCGSDLRLYREIRKDGAPRYVDPVEEHVIKRDAEK